MIIGIGSDLIDIRRIEKSFARFGERFEKRVFTKVEIAKANTRGDRGHKTRVATFAKRFAAKEAFAKAIGTGLGQGVSWQEISVENLPSGEPTLRISGKAEQHVKRLTPAGMKASIKLSLTDEYPFAQAFVILSAE